MKRVIKLLALTFVCGLALAGCKKEKKTGAGTGSAVAGTAAGTAAAPGTAASKPAGTAAGTAAAGTGTGTAAAGTGDGTGGGDIPAALASVPACKAYIQFYNCYLGKMPPAASAPAKKAFAKSVEMWAKMPKGPGVGKACQMAMDAQKKAASASPAFKKYYDACAPK